MIALIKGEHKCSADALLIQQKVYSKKAIHYLVEKHGKEALEATKKKGK